MHTNKPIKLNFYLIKMFEACFEWPKPLKRTSKHRRAREETKRNIFFVMKWILFNEEVFITRTLFDFLPPSMLNESFSYLPKIESNFVVMKILIFMKRWIHWIVNIGRHTWEIGFRVRPTSKKPLGALFSVLKEAFLLLHLCGRWFAP